MLGHKWERAQATIVGVETAPPGGHGASSRLEHSYVVAVRSPNGEMLRGTVTHRSLVALPVGGTIPVEVNAKSGQVRADPNFKDESARDMLQSARQLRAEIGQAAGGGAAPIPGGATDLAGLVGLAAKFGQAGADMTGVTGPALTGPMVAGSVHVVGPGGQDLNAAGLSAGEMTGLVQAMTSGDPAARQAARERLMQIKEQVSHQAGATPADPGHAGPAGPEGFTGGAGPATFDPIGEPAGSFSFGQPAAPDPFQQVTPPAPMLAGSFGAFDTGPGEGSTEQKLAKLRQLLDKGILTESEYQAQVRQVNTGG